MIYLGQDMVGVAFRTNPLPIEFVKFDGSHYLNTGINARTGLEITIETIFLDSPAYGSSNAIFGATGSGGYDERCTLNWFYGSNGYEIYHYFGNNSYPRFSFNSAGKHIFKATNGVVTLDGTQKLNTNPTDFTTNVPIVIAATNNNGTIENFSQMLVSAFSIKDIATDTMLCSLTPHIDDNNVPCLYDSVTDSNFYLEGNDG